MEERHRNSANGSGGLSDAQLVELKAGLSKPLPEIPARYFYDDRGSALFEQITELPEYYQTRTELQILRAHAAEVLTEVPAETLTELGSGSGSKIGLLIEAGRQAGHLKQVTFLDVNAGMVQSAQAAVVDAFPGVTTRGIVGDFLTDLGKLEPAACRLLILFGGTIGNLHPDDALGEFLSRVASVLSPQDGFLVGVDRVKATDVLEAAYNDSQGVTAAFNRNILRSLSDRIGGALPDEDFEHRAFFDRDRSWIEMRLRATRSVRLDFGRLAVQMDLQRGDEIRTEISCKYTREAFAAHAQRAGLQLTQWHTDPAELFALALLRPMVTP